MSQTKSHSQLAGMHKSHSQSADTNTVNIRSAFKAWGRDHQDSSATTGGRRLIDSQFILARALGLLPILDMFASANPVAGAVVSTFKVLITFEAERRENKSRVAVVLLAQTQMMSAFLEYALISSGFYEGLLERVRLDIQDCGNAIDTYCKEPRLGIRMEEYPSRIHSKFEGRRGEIQLMLSLRTAGAVDGITSKVDAMRESLDLLFTQQEDWERRLESRIPGFGPDQSWMEDDDTLRHLVSITSDPLLNPSTLVPNNPRNVDALAALKGSMHTSLDALCIRNSEIFYRKLDLQTERLKDAVEMSAKYVIRELSGPYDRLWNEDLRKLWKEMVGISFFYYCSHLSTIGAHQGWAFCVENQQFSQALCEYFSDRLSPPSFGGKHVPRAPLNDAWALQCLSTHAHQISNIIDSDGSGYIRISEANVFTAKMPDGWSLPQWCCYTALGIPYERLIYRDRINNIVDRITLGGFSKLELNALIIPSPKVTQNGKSVEGLEGLIRLGCLEVLHSTPATHPDPHIPRNFQTSQQLLEPQARAEPNKFRSHKKFE
ncbi:hypothetical protein BD779DRAFT_1479771 [Infundibulicybe gibba]|nr:hypothetical protein BD779DRAFT_1479771 [Infundibulicybe gibba]